jgi:cyclophilin family peptidyl-prolyl cis-trans isomerase
MNSPLKRAGAILGVMAIVAAAMFGAAIATPSASIGQETKPHLMLTLKDGVVDIELLPELAPLHVQRVVELTEAGAYDSVVFHRVIEDFMAQTGDVKFGKHDSPDYNIAYAGMGGSDLPDVKAEFSSESHVRGVVGAARTMDPDTFNSQFFICFKDCSFLDGDYTVFGKVVAGMELVDNITRGEPPADPDMIISAKIENR